MSRRVLITGSSGFLGRSFLHGFKARDFELVPVAGPRSSHTVLGVRLDLTDKPSLRAMLREVRPTHVLNFASRGVSRDHSTLPELLAVNAIGAIHLIDGLMEEGLTPQTYCFGTAYEYAESQNLLHETSPLNPKSPYAISKTTLYYALKTYGGVAPLTFLRLFNVFGAGEPPERLIPFIVSKARAAEPIPLTHGAQLRDFMYIQDLIGILGRLITAPEHATPGLRTFNVGTSKGIALRKFIEMVGLSLSRRGLHPDFRFGELPYRAQDPMSCVADHTALRKVLGELDFTDLQTAIDRTVAALYEH